ncbi:hypothetical protein GCM10008905_06460 [Clostridium malenominatum]|uniref:Uncharacterized protein n=1 Tax=Clostridium malenominatum TaxID=1539 RepID=A0ABN1IPY6_9CLOT
MKKKSITHLFKTNIGGLIPIGKRLTSKDIFDIVEQLGGFYEGYSRKENERRVRSAINNAVNYGRLAILKGAKGFYVFY